MLKVSPHFPDLNATKDRDVQVDDYFYSEVDWVKVDDYLCVYSQRFELGICNKEAKLRKNSVSLRRWARY